MPQRQGLKYLLDEARSTLNRLVLGIHVAHMPRLRTNAPVKLSYTVDSKSRRFDSSIHPRSAKQEFSIPPTMIEDIPGISIEEKRIPTDFDVGLKIRSMHDSCEVTVEKMPCQSLCPEAATVDIIPPSASRAEFIDFRIDEPESCSEDDIPLEPGEMFEIDPAFDKIPRHGLDIMYNVPVRLHPTPWTDLERSFIVLCWDRLRGSATEKFGHDPGRDLEMCAVFARVDMRNVRRTRYDAKERVLKLYMASPMSRGKSDLGRCAIIVGLEKETGRLIQIALPLDNRR